MELVPLDICKEIANKLTQRDLARIVGYQENVPVFKCSHLDYFRLSHAEPDYFDKMTSVKLFEH